MGDGKFTQGNPGKRKGTINKNTKLVKEVFAEAFTELQKDKTVNLIAWGKKHPTEFYKIVSRLIPMDAENLSSYNVKIRIE